MRRQMQPRPASRDFAAGHQRIDERAPAHRRRAALTSAATARRRFRSSGMLVIRAQRIDRPRLQCAPVRLAITAPSFDAASRGPIASASSGKASAFGAKPVRCVSIARGMPSGACASSASRRPASSHSASASSHARRAGVRRLRAGPNGSSTRPPPTVRVACGLRTMNRSPGSANTGSSNTSCTRIRWPAASVSPSSSATCATRCSVPRCTCSGAQCVSVAASASSVSSTSRRGEVATSRASATVSPRSTSALSTPARFSAQRSRAAGLDRPVLRVDAAHARRAARAHDRERVAGRDAARERGARHDGTLPREREHAIDREPEQPVVAAGAPRDRRDGQ